MTLDIRKIIFLIILLLGYYFFYLEYNLLIKINKNINIGKIDQKETINSEIKKNNKINKKKFIKKETKANSELNQIEITINKGDTFISILENFRFTNIRAFEIINKIEEVFDLKKLKVNEKIIFYVDKNNTVKKIEIQIDFDSLLIVTINKNILLKTVDLEKNYFQESKEFNIYESLYSDGLKNNLPDDILIKLIKLFSFDLDFQRDIKKDTLVSVSYDFYQINKTNKLSYKDINYAMILIENKKLEYFKFLTDDGFIDYFNRKGKNVKKSLLKTPLDGARLSSSFGMRKHPISGYNKMHKGVDFAAPKGTPVYAGGNGVIEYLGNNGGYGKYIRLRHNNEYKTAYAHLSGYKKGLSKGKRVNQGDIIGYVGSTGKSTGPHLHYEILFQNKQINPLKLKLPSGKVLIGKELNRFEIEYKKIYANHLNLLYE